MAVIIGNPRPTIVSSGLQLYVNAGISTSYPGSGTTLYDLSGYGRNFTLNNSIGYTTISGRSGLTFNGTNQYASSNTSLSFNSLTYILAFRRDGTQGGGTPARLLEVRDSQSYYFGISNYSTTNNKLTWEYASGDYNVDTGLTTSDLTWQFGALTIDNTGSSSVINVYLNKQVFTYTRSLYNSPSSTTTLYIGSKSGGSQGFFKGTIGAALLYTRALTQAEVLQNYYTLNFFP